MTRPPWVDAYRKGATAPIRVEVVPDLFPTPPALAARMVELADVKHYHDVLEPSAGTGNLVRALGPTGCNVLAVEINPTLCANLETLGAHVACDDFMEWGNLTIRKFDRAVMNPPFGGGRDIAHIRLARGLLKPGGRLVALCANGPKQREKLKPIARSWEDLEDGSFHEAGTNVRVALLMIEAP